MNLTLQDVNKVIATACKTYDLGIATNDLAHLSSQELYLSRGFTYLIGSLIGNPMTGNIDSFFYDLRVGLVRDYAMDVDHAHYSLKELTKRMQSSFFNKDGVVLLQWHYKFDQYGLAHGRLTLGRTVKVVFGTQYPGDTVALPTATPW